MTFAELSIRRSVLAWMMMAAIILFGAIAFDRLGISQLPDVNFPVVMVSLSLQGAAPEMIESQVLDPLEDSIMQIDGIRSVTSTAQQNTGSIAVEFELNRNIDLAMEDVQGKISQVQNLLPTNLFPPTLRKTNPEDQPILWLTLTTDDPNINPMALMMYARDFLYDQFSTVPGVGNIGIGGYVNPALRVFVNADKLNAANFTSDDVVASITAGDNEIPAGQITNPQENINVRALGQAASPADFGKIGIENRNNWGPNYQTTHLSDIADIEEGISDLTQISSYNKKRAVGLGIIKQHGSNAVEVARLVRKKLEELKPIIPKGFHVAVVNDFTRFIEQSVNELKFNLLLSALLTSVVCILFLGSWTSTLNVLLAIPTSVIGTFTAAYFFGFTLNAFTLLGLSLAIGIIVDDSIMMLENIMRHREAGEDKIRSALIGAEEVTFAATAATIAVVAIFIPVVFMPGVLGRYFLQYGVIVAVAVLLSLFEAITLTPMRCSRFLESSNSERGLARYTSKLLRFSGRFYEKWLAILLQHPVLTLMAAVVVFFISLMIARLVPTEMMPAQDQSMLLIRFKLPPGASIYLTQAKMTMVENYLLAQPEVSGVYSAVGGFSGASGANVNTGNDFVTLVDPRKRKLSQSALINKFRANIHRLIPDMEANFQDMSLRGFSATRGFPVEFLVRGSDWDTLTKVTFDLMSKLRKSGVVTDVNTDVQSGMPEVQITPDRSKLAARAVDLATVTSGINALMGGYIFNKEIEYPKEGHRYEIEVQLVANQRNKVQDLNLVRLRNNRGDVVPLKDVVDIQVRPALTLIQRLNRSRAILVYANVAKGHSQQEALAIAQKLAQAALPPGYTYETWGNSQSFQQSIQSLIFALLLGILVSYMVLASQFNSFVHPIAVLMALPFSVSGALVALWLFRQSINIYSMIGLILLMGIVKKNSIMLVDFTNQVRSKGLDVKAALLHACPVRFRPIIMTSMAVVAGALPEAFSLGPGSETVVPMAVTIIGGMIASTALTLFVVPCVYSLLSHWEVKEREVPKAAA